MARGDEAAWVNITVPGSPTQVPATDSSGTPQGLPAPLAPPTVAALAVALGLGARRRPRAPAGQVPA